MSNKSGFGDGTSGPGDTAYSITVQPATSSEESAIVNKQMLTLKSVRPVFR